MVWDAIIIGSGPAGLAAAVFLKGYKVLLLEKEEVLSKKLKLTGGGQCNLTHVGEIDHFKDKYDKKWRFISHAMMTYRNEDMMKYFRRHDCPLVIMDSGKVFPESLKANDVVDVLLKDTDAAINKGEAVLDIVHDDIFQVKTGKGNYQTKNVIVATGGNTYPKTGSTGDGIKFAKSLDIKTKAYEYALSPIYVKHHILSDLMGLSFESVSLDHYRGKKIASYKGDLLITHFGYSGPAIINASRWMAKEDKLIINFTSYEPQDFENLLLEDMKQFTKKTIKTILSKFVQNRLAEKALSHLAIDEKITASEFNKKDRKALVKLLTMFEVTIDSVGKSHIAMVSRGGILTSELNKKTFESKKHKGLYFVGECVDVDGDTGGYNIQYAFSSSYVACQEIKESLNE